MSPEFISTSVRNSSRNVHITPISQFFHVIIQRDVLRSVLIPEIYETKVSVTTERGTYPLKALSLKMHLGRTHLLNIILWHNTHASYAR